MPSFDSVNYSLRPSKSIQRALIFSGLRWLQERVEWENALYIGLGSVWFTDFVAAHKTLGIEQLVSIEADPVGFQRALYNAPYATVKVHQGLTSQVLPDLRKQPDLAGRPWIMWLDYDGSFDESIIDDIRWGIENAPENSVLLVTANGHEMNFGHATERVQRLRDIFGDVVPDGLPQRACRDDRMQETLANLALDLMQSIAADTARPGGFVPAFRVLYKDGAPMVTVGGVLPTKGASALMKDWVASAAWKCKPSKPILAPHLTIRESASLQALLPHAGQLTRAAVKALGFDLEEEQIETFQKYYRYYPAFAQIVS